MAGHREKSAARDRVLFSCAEKVAQDPAAQRLLAEVFAPFDLSLVPSRSEDRRAFAAAVTAVDAMLDDLLVAVGHGFDAWVLMAAAAERAARSVAVPYLLLLNPVLGACQHLNGSLLGYRAPRGRRVRAAFGLDVDEDGCRALIERTTYVFGDNDPHSSLRDWRYLRGLGCGVHVVRGWHERNRVAVESQVRDILVDYLRDLADRLARGRVSG